MAAVLMHGQCLSLGLNVAALVNAFSTLTDTSSTLLLGTAGTCQEQVRNEKECLDEVVETRTWHLYTSRKYTFSKKQRFRSQQLAPGADGIAVSKTHFSSGRERYAFDCTEVACEVKGFRLVAKKSRAEKKLRFHERIAKTQSAAQAMADCFNKRLQSCFDSPQPALLLHFVPCAIYEVDEVSRSGGRAWFLVEPLLEGRFCKWNNNAGGVRKNIGVTVRIGTSELCIDDVTQAFSHFSYERSNHSALICDMQGIWNAVDGFSLTDPVIHHVGCNRKHRADTDFGGAGIDSFLATHKCSTLCQMLKLPFIEPRLSKHKQHTFESVLRRHQAY
ncbi:uncharacterized protein MONBRDRAFT_23474 [Monosiga brevicollis MX1]|uniref:Alpha-type protein kinase domain-containing protein n=1 Tax=Monosiga brevicollis TaxID=81824 RepID=A9UTI7_MONBE|nr:uncharacterized protein MONBRDRAFT_23474 [Monosiga brevicollis MX1]EDQ91500.1 predicted protein [Monosiga brevicollis MX1]|eukprot:XP_001743922.1 hypothetical protein [Monosiga brevicollis MX1]